MSNGESHWVIDSCSLFDVRRSYAKSTQRQIWDALTSLVRGERLCWPAEVSHEVARGREDDPASRWIKRYRDDGERSAGLETVKAVLKNAPTLIDPDIPHEQADPYVLALALDLSNLFTRAIIITEDRVDKGKGMRKLSLTTAAGMHGVAVVPLHAFLTMEQINVGGGGV